MGSTSTATSTSTTAAKIKAQVDVNRAMRPGWRSRGTCHHATVTVFCWDNTNIVRSNGRPTSHDVSTEHLYLRGNRTRRTRSRTLEHWNHILSISNVLANLYDYIVNVSGAMLAHWRGDASPRSIHCCSLDEIAGAVSRRELAAGLLQYRVAPRGLQRGPG